MVEVTFHSANVGVEKAIAGPIGHELSGDRILERWRPEVCPCVFQGAILKAGRKAMKIDPKELESILGKLLEVYKPLQVFLYGSQAWGEPEKGSDIDLFIVLETSELELDERIRLGVRALSGSGLDIDLLVMTRAEVAARKDHPSTLTHKILAKGIKLYEAA